MANIVFVFGNGLSQGFDERLRLADITGRARDRIGPLIPYLDQFAALARPDGPAGELNPANFEHLAGPLDRIAEALVAIEGLVRLDAQPVRALREASAELRRVYLTVVGTILSEIDSCCVEPVPDEARREAWVTLDDFTMGLTQLTPQHEVAVYNLNYDSLLTASTLRTFNDWFYDGFRGRVLNDPLDRWEANRFALYHLHGSISWVNPVHGEIAKRPLDEIRALHLPRWIDGDGGEGWPLVVLSDLKERSVRRYPFSLFYDQLRVDLSSADAVIVGGYGFGDQPVNDELSRAVEAGQTIEVWAPAANDRCELYARHLNQTNPRRIRGVDVHLPQAEVIQDLTARLNGGR